MRRIIGASLATALTASALAIPASAQTVTKFSVLAIEVASHDVSSDTFAFRDRLVQPGNRSNVLGHDEVTCTQISRSTIHCRAVFFFPAGKVKAKGNIDTRRHLNKIPVIGGTRAYNGVGGKAVVHLGNSNTLIDFTLVK